MSMPEFKIKKRLLALLNLNEQKLTMGRMFFRPYNPLNETIKDKYSANDWKLIFESYDEEDLKDLQRCANVIILMWCDTDTAKAHGMVYLEEPYNDLGALHYHGGTWDHNPKLFVEIFHSQIKLFNMLLNIGAGIKTTCGTKNIRADKYQKSLGFIEYDQDENLSYKMLDKDKFLNSPLVKRMGTL